jgi:hypothetical protein
LTFVFLASSLSLSSLFHLSQVRAFDISFGRSRATSKAAGNVCRVSKYIGGGSYGRVFLAKEIVPSSKFQTKKCQYLREKFAWCSSGFRATARPEGKSVAIKFLPPKSNMREVHVGCLATREGAVHLGQTLYVFICGYKHVDVFLFFNYLVWFSSLKNTNTQTH